MGLSSGEVGLGAGPQRSARHEAGELRPWNLGQWNEESQAALCLHADIGTLHAPATDSLHPQVSTMNTSRWLCPGAQSRLPPVHPLRGPGGHRPGAARPPPNLSSSPRSPLVSSVVIPWGLVFPGPSPGHLIPILEVPVVLPRFPGQPGPKTLAWGPCITAQQLLCTSVYPQHPSHLHSPRRFKALTEWAPGSLGSQPKPSSSQGLLGWPRPGMGSASHVCSPTRTATPSTPGNSANAGR